MRIRKEWGCEEDHQCGDDDQDCWKILEELLYGRDPCLLYREAGNDRKADFG